MDAVSDINLFDLALSGSFAIWASFYFFATAALVWERLARSSKTVVVTTAPALTVADADIRTLRKAGDLSEPKE